MAAALLKNIMQTAAAMVLVTAVASLLAATGSAQPALTCASKLASCAPYLNSTSPPESCCGPLKDALANELPCLCAIFNSPDILKAFHIDLNSAIQLPKNCGMPSFSTTVACVNTTAGAPGASIAPPATPGGEKSNASPRSATWVVLSSFLSLFLFWWAAFAYEFLV